MHRPRDIRAFGHRPCEVFSVEQLAAFGFDLPPASTDTLPSGNRTCVWFDSGYTGRLAVIVYPDWDILERVYRNQAMAGVSPRCRWPGARGGAPERPGGCRAVT